MRSYIRKQRGSASLQLFWRPFSLVRAARAMPAWCYCYPVEKAADSTDSYLKGSSGVAYFPCCSFYELIGRIHSYSVHDVYILYGSAVLHFSSVIDDSCLRIDTCRKQAITVGPPRADITQKAR